jgi:hypothetical protein
MARSIERSSTLEITGKDLLRIERTASSATAIIEAKNR